MRGKWAIITGASSGIGAELAAALAEKGANLVLVARRVEPMERLAADLRARHNIEVRVESVDLAVAGAAGALKARLDAQGIAVETLINNAGLGLISEFLDQPFDKIAGMLQLNVFGLTEMTRVFAQSMKEQGGGHILMVASIAGMGPCPFYAAYAATKAYVVSLGEALHTELAPHNVHVTVLMPGVTDTEFFQAAGEKPTAAMLKMMMTPRAVADIGVKALYGRKASVVAGGINRAIVFSGRFVSRQFMARVAYKLGRENKSK